MSEEHVTVAGVGNILCRDDGVGVHIIRQLRSRRLPPGVSLVDAGTADIGSILHASRARKLIVIDAVRGGGAPGTVYRFPLNGIPHEDRGSMTSLHQISLYESYLMARLVQKEVPEVIVVGVEPQCTEFGMEVSPAVRRKYGEIMDTVLREITGRTEQGEPPRGGAHDRY